MAYEHNGWYQLLADNKGIYFTYSNTDTPDSHKIIQGCQCLVWASRKGNEVRYEIEAAKYSGKYVYEVKNMITGAVHLLLALQELDEEQKYHQFSYTLVRKPDHD